MNKVPIPEIRRDASCVYFNFRPDAPIHHTIEVVDDEVMMDVDEDGYLIGIDILLFPDDTYGGN